jgi:hypothetical protein
MTRKLQFVSRIAQNCVFAFYHIAQKTIDKPAKTANIDKIHSKNEKRAFSECGIITADDMFGL